MKRTFIAVKVEAGDKLRDLVTLLKAELKSESVRWVDTDHLHITLAFLGDTSDETINQVITILQNTCEEFGEINFRIKGLGVFRSINDPRVIWAGTESTEKLESLFKILQTGLESIAIRSEAREFKPHLTLGRVKWLKNKATLERLVDQFDKTIFNEVYVPEVILFESILQQSGPLYLPIFIASLK